MRSAIASPQYGVARDDSAGLSRVAMRCMSARSSSMRRRRPVHSKRWETLPTAPVLHTLQWNLVVSDSGLSLPDRLKSAVRAQFLSAASGAGNSRSFESATISLVSKVVFMASGYPRFRHVFPVSSSRTAQSPSARARLRVVNIPAARCWMVRRRMGLAA